MRRPNRKVGQLLDEINWAVLSALQENARMPYSKLAKRVGLSVPATIERIRKLEDAGIITGYYARVDAKKLGLPILAAVRCSGTGAAYRPGPPSRQNPPDHQRLPFVWRHLLFGDRRCRIHRASRKATR